MKTSAIQAEVRIILCDVLGVPEKRFPREGAAPLLGAVPELDSMAVVAVLTALEERFGITVEDDDLSADVFETLSALSHFVDEKMAGRSIDSKT